MLFNLLQAAADTAAIAQTEAVQQEMKLSLIELASKGGWLMIVLLILSLLAIYIFGNKWWLIRKVHCGRYHPQRYILSRAGTPRRTPASGYV